MKYIVDYKWHQLSTPVYLYNAILLSYYGWLLVLQLEPWAGTEGGMTAAYAVHLAFSSLVAIPEVHQNYSSFRQLFRGGGYGFEDFQNNYEILGYLLQIVYAGFVLSGVLDREGPDALSYTQKRDILSVNFVSCLFLLARSFFLLRVFNSLRPYVRMVKEVLANLGPFTVILVAACALLALVYYMLHELHVETKHADVDYVTYDQMLLGHVTLVATGMYDEEIVSLESTGNYVLFLGAFYVIFIVFLNLLIAIISERFAIVLEQTTPMDCIERATLMLEIEDFTQWWQGVKAAFGRVSPEADEELYINVCRYLKRAAAGEEDAGEAEAEGRMRALGGKILKLGEESEAAFDEMTSKQKEIKDAVSTLQRQAELNETLRENQQEIILQIEELKRDLRDQVRAIPTTQASKKKK